MTNRSAHKKKIAVVGTGMVGSTFAYTAVLKEAAHEIVLINKEQDRAEGEAMDINHAMPFCSPMSIRAGGYEDCSDADLIVITAGAPQKEGQSRLELVAENARITKKIVSDIMEHARNPILLVVSNPVDVLTYVALKESGLPSSRVIGSGTVLDSARLRYLLSDHCGVDPRNVHAHIVGEHGDSELALWSRANIGGILMDEFCRVCQKSCPIDIREKILEQVRGSAYEIISRKEATYYGIGMSLVRIADTILDDERSILTVSALMEGEYGVEDVCMSLPRLVTREGVTSTLHADIAPTEMKALKDSAGVVRETLDSIDY